jgi:hypothetical protein
MTVLMPGPEAEQTKNEKPLSSRVVGLKNPVNWD